MQRWPFRPSIPIASTMYVVKPAPPRHTANKWEEKLQQDRGQAFGERHSHRHTTTRADVEEPTGLRLP